MSTPTPRTEAVAATLHANTADLDFSDVAKMHAHAVSLENECRELREALKSWQHVWEETDCEYDDCAAAAEQARQTLAKYDHE